MLRFKQFILENYSYRGEHTSPDKESGAPIHDMTKLFPEDIYSLNASRLYGHGDYPMDNQSISIIHSTKNKPNRKITIYRAVPKIQSSEEKISDLEGHKRYILKTGKLPKGVAGFKNSSEYYEHATKEIEKLKNNPETPEKLTINPGDWVTINRKYAKNHGESTLNNNYRIIKKLVPAKHLYSDGDIHEYGYDPD